MQRTLILHIGLGKSGSTSIQKYMEQFAGRTTGTICYPTSPDIGLYSEHVCRSFFSPDSAALLEDARLYLKQHNEDTYVVSGEILTHSDNILKSKVIDFFSSLFSKIFFVAYVRNPFKWNSASASQLLVDGISINNLMRWPYFETQYGFLQYYLDSTKRYNKNSLVIRKFEDAINLPGGVSEDFKSTVENICGKKLPATTVGNLHENKSKTMIEYLLLGHMNKLRDNGNSVDKESLTNFQRNLLNNYNDTPLLKQGFFQFYALPQVKITTDYDTLMLGDRFKISYETQNQESLPYSQAANINNLLNSAQCQSELFDLIENYLQAGNG